MDGAEKSLETLVVWQFARRLVSEVYQQVLPQLPEEEKWGLANQLRRAAVCIPANIAEGYGRYYYQESVRFCYIARGSLEETFTYLALAADLGYITSEVYQTISQDVSEVRRLLNGYIGFLKRSKRGHQEAGVNLSISEPPVAYAVPGDLETVSGSSEEADWHTS